MTGIAAPGQARVSGVELGEVAGLDRLFDGFDRFAGRRLHHVRHRLIAELGPPASDVCERILELMGGVARERPVLVARAQPQFGMARLHERVHEIGEARTEGWRSCWLGVCDLAGEGPKLMRTAVRPMRARAHLSIKSLRPNGAARRDPPRGMTGKARQPALIEACPDANADARSRRCFS